MKQNKNRTRKDGGISLCVNIGSEVWRLLLRFVLWPEEHQVWRMHIMAEATRSLFTAMQTEAAMWTGYARSEQTATGLCIMTVQDTAPGRDTAHIIILTDSG